MKFVALLIKYKNLLLIRCITSLFSVLSFSFLFLYVYFVLMGFFSVQELQKGKKMYFC